MPKNFKRHIKMAWALMALLMLTCITYAQKTVAGKVVSKTDNQPLQGATIRLKGTRNIVQTSQDGSFTIKMPADKGTLEITVVGYEKFDLPVTAGSAAGEISLTASATTLNDVVVTGYSTQRKKDITGAVTVVNVANMKSLPSGSTESLLQGQAAGVTVINTGAPGGVSNVRIRGITSTGNTDPLVIIDGTPGNLHDVNVNDVLSIQVLKDAGSAAIYGVRGSNGVIIVTTKRGKAGKTQLSYDAYYGTQRPLKKGYNLANPTETANGIWQEYLNDGLTPFHKQYGGGATPVIPDYITPFGTMAGDPRTDPSQYALYTNQITKANKSGTDWFHEIFKPAKIQSHNISASGGGDKSSYFFSFNYLDQDGTLIYTKLKRYSARINTTFSMLNDHIRIGENAYVVYKQNPGYLNLAGVNNANSINASYREPLIIPVYDIKGNFAGSGSQSLGNSPQPVAIQSRQANNTNNAWQVNGNIFAEVDLLQHVTVRSSIGGRFDNFFNNSFVYTQYENAENAQNPNSYIESYGWNTSLTWTNTVKYTNTFADKHNLTVLLGSEYISNGGRAVGTSRGGYYITNPTNLTVDPNLWTLNFGSPQGQTNSNITSNNGTPTPYQSAVFSLFGRLDYNFSDKYLLSATLRRDGASVFDPAKRYGYFPSVSAGWRISRESFMKDIAWVNDLKIRGSWGKLGSLNNINPTNAYTLFGQASNQSYYDINGSGIPTQGLFTSQYGNPNTTWEQDIITNIGLDASIIQNKFDVSVEWYKKSISGLLFVPNTPGTNGGGVVPFANAGNISNSGIDIALTYHGTIHRDFKIDVTGSFTSYNNKVISLPEGRQYFDFNGVSRLQPGHPVGAFFGYNVLGLFQDMSDVSKSAKQDGAAPGRFKYQDVNNDGKIDASDRTFFGNPNPKFTAGLNLNIAYKNFDFLAFFYASVGNDVLNLVRQSTDFPQQFDAAMSKDVALNSAWLVNASGQRTNILDPTARVANPETRFPMLERIANFSNATAFNSYFKENGSFLRCRNMTLGYSFNSPRLTKIGFDRVRIYVQASNLFNITKYTGLDPELPGSNTVFGTDGGAYPNNQKSFNAGVNIGLH